MNSGREKRPHNSDPSPYSSNNTTSTNGQKPPYNPVDPAYNKAYYNFTYNPAEKTGTNNTNNTSNNNTNTYNKGYNSARANYTSSDTAASSSSSNNNTSNIPFTMDQLKDMLKKYGVR